MRSMWWREDVEIRNGKQDDPLTREEMKMFRKYVGKLNWLSSNMRPDLAVYALGLAQRQKDAKIKDLKTVNRVLKRMREKESKIEFSRVGGKGELCVMGVSDASYHQQEKSTAGEIIMLGSTRTPAAVPLYWRSGVVRNVCMSPKAAETRAMVKLVDDSTYIRQQLELMLGYEIGTRLFTDSRPLLETLGSSSQIEEKQLRKSIAFLKQFLETENVDSYSWIEGTEIVADVFTKQGSQRKEMDEIVRQNKFWSGASWDNMVTYEDGEIKIQNLTMKAERGNKSRKA